MTKDSYDGYAEYIKQVLEEEKAISILYDKELMVFLSWGTEEVIEGKYKHDFELYIKANLLDTAKALTVLHGLTDLTEIIKIITHAGYIGRYVEK